MKASHLINIIQSNYTADEEIIVMWWDKSAFDFPDDYEIVLTADGWTKTCKEFDQWEDAGNDISQWISDAVIENSECN